MELFTSRTTPDVAKNGEIETSNLRERLAATAEQWAARPLIGNEHKYGPDLEPILRYFPREHPDIGFDRTGVPVNGYIRIADTYEVR